MSEEKRRLHPEETYGHKLRMLHNCIEKYMDAGRMHDEEGMTGVQCSTIAFLIQKEEEGKTVFQKDIEAAFSISGATASNILKGMEKKGLIERVAVEKDARLKKIVLTDRAYACDRRAMKRIFSIEQAIRDGMTDEEAAIFMDLLTRALDNVEALSDNL